MDEDIQLLRVLSDTATNFFQNKKSNISRINSMTLDNTEKEKWKADIIRPLDETLRVLEVNIHNILIKIPVYNYFLSQQTGINTFEAAQLIGIIVDIEDFDELKNLVSYAGFTPYSHHYNKKLHKLLLKIGYKLVQYNSQYQFIYNKYIEKYKKKNPTYSQKHIENMAKRIVIRKFLKNLFISWKAVNRVFE